MGRATMLVEAGSHEYDQWSQMETDYRVSLPSDTPAYYAFNQNAVVVRGTDEYSNWPSQPD